MGKIDTAMLRSLVSEFERQSRMSNHSSKAHLTVDDARKVFGKIAKLLHEFVNEIENKQEM